MLELMTSLGNNQITFTFIMSFLLLTGRFQATAFMTRPTTGTIKTAATATSSTQVSASILDDFQAVFQKTFSSSSNSSTPSSESPYFTVAITGSSGLVGKALIDELSKKSTIGRKLIQGKPIKVVKLIRSSADSLEGSDLFNDDENSKDTTTSTITTLPWNPSSGTSSTAINSKALESIDCIVHLAGENVATGLGILGPLGIRPWTEEKKNLILSSRITSTTSLAHTLSTSTTTKPITFITASGVGIYGYDFFKNSQEDNNVGPDESTDTSNTKGFLADVSRAWESASYAATGGKKNRNRVVNLRLAPVMSKQGGALAKLYPIFFLGGGGIVGSGNQYFSYVSARDAARAIVHTIETPSLQGPVNVVAPTPCTNADFTKELGASLSRPTILPLPEFAVKLLFGEMGDEMLLGGVKAFPKKLLNSGFRFEHDTIKKAIESAQKEDI